MNPGDTVTVHQTGQTGHVTEVTPGGHLLVVLEGRTRPLPYAASELVVLA